VDLIQAEGQLNALIERRALKASAEQERIEDLWKASAAVHREQARQTNRAAWYAYHLDQADRIRRTMTTLVEAHEARARELLGEGSV
jgi:hypothetical protein